MDIVILDVNFELGQLDVASSIAPYTFLINFPSVFKPVSERKAQLETWYPLGK